MKDFLLRRLVRPIAEQLTQGLSPDSIALTIAIGLAIAVIPVVGTTTLLCTTAAIVLKLNQPLIQAINYLSFPLQIAFIVPFLRLGRLLFGGPVIRMSAAELAAFVSSRPMDAAETLWRVTLQSLGAWLLTTPLIVATVYFALRPVLRATARRLRSGNATVERSGAVASSGEAGAEGVPLDSVPVRSPGSRVGAEASVSAPRSVSPGGAPVLPFPGRR